jgi:hypothetical protein
MPVCTDAFGFPPYTQGRRLGYTASLISFVRPVLVRAVALLLFDRFTSCRSRSKGTVQRSAAFLKWTCIDKNVTMTLVL